MQESGKGYGLIPYFLGFSAYWTWPQNAGFRVVWFEAQAVQAPCLPALSHIPQSSIPQLSWSLTLTLDSGPTSVPAGTKAKRLYWREENLSSIQEVIKKDDTAINNVST